MQQVADWLEKLGLGQYAQRFAENDISFGVLADLSDYFQAAQAKLIDCLGTRVSFTLGVHGDLGRQIAELIADVPAALAAI